MLYLSIRRCTPDRRPSNVFPMNTIVIDLCFRCDDVMMTKIKCLFYATIIWLNTVSSLNYYVSRSEYFAYPVSLIFKHKTDTIRHICCVGDSIISGILRQGFRAAVSSTAYNGTDPGRRHRRRARQPRRTRC